MSFLKDLRAWLDQLRGKGPAAAIALTLDLGEARDNKPFNLEAGGLIVESCGGDLYARINGPNGDGLNLRCVHRILYPVTSLFLTNTAQTGKSARLLLLPTGMDTDVIGDMARKAYYDRNPYTIQRVYEANVSQGFGWDLRWTYTVPTGKKFVGCVAAGYIMGSIVGSTSWALLKVQHGNVIIFLLGHWYDHGYMTSDTKTVPVVGLAGDVFYGYTWNLDSAAHGMCVALVGVEFDA